MEKKIIYTPRKWTKPLHCDDKRWKVIVAHRRAGKTTGCLNHLTRDAIKTPNSRYAYIGPTYRMSKNVAWDILKGCTREIHGTKPNEVELKVDFANGARVTLYGSDSPDALRGMGLWGVIFDEYELQPPNIFSEIIRPSLTDHNGYAIWIGTPKGMNDFYELYKQAKDDDDWLAMLLTVDDTGLISEKELADARKTMSEDEYQQEFYCSWEAAIKGAYYSGLIKNVMNVPYEKSIKVDTYWDIGVGDATAIWFCQNVGYDIRLIDYYETSGEGLEYYIRVLQERKYIYGKHYAPHDIEVKEFSTGQSRKNIASRLGINFQVVPKLTIDDGINAVRMILNQCYFDKEKCKQGINALKHYHKEYDDKRREFKQHPYHDWSSHSADSFRYLAVTHRWTKSNSPHSIYGQRGRAKQTGPLGY